jgi:hypothetical protein
MINIFIDTSGSMSEMGKDSGVIYIVKSILDYCKIKNIQVVLCKLDGSTIENIFSLKFNEKIQSINIDKGLNTILISDGFLESEDNFFDISFAIGIDCDKANLNKISKRVFESENIVQAVEYLIYQHNILENIAETEDDEDEW